MLLTLTLKLVLICFINNIWCNSAVSYLQRTEWENDEVIQRLRDYLKIPSVHPNPDYADCVIFLRNQAQLMGLPVSVYELVPTKPVVVITWTGLQSELPSILLNSHMDVVAVYEDLWTSPPFVANITEDGWIISRGAQDMKSVGMMHLEAIRRLKTAGVRLQRTVHISFVPDEEINSVGGMNVFAESEHFRKMNVGFSLDESAPTQSDTVIKAFNGERTPRQIKVTSRGKPGHGTQLASNTAGEKLLYVINKLMELRAQQKLLHDNGVLLGKLITINLTQLEGGIQVNVLPENLTAIFDIRLPPSLDHEEFENKLLTWCNEAGDGVTFVYIEKNPVCQETKIDDTNPYWVALYGAVKDMGLDVSCVICPGATDARFLRQQGIPVINFSPILNTPGLTHAHNERIHVDSYKKGIDIMEKVLVAVANVQ